MGADSQHAIVLCTHILRANGCIYNTVYMFRPRREQFVLWGGVNSKEKQLATGSLVASL